MQGVRAECRCLLLCDSILASDGLGNAIHEVQH